MPNLDLYLNGPQSRAYEALKAKQTVCLPWGRGVGKSWFIRNAAWLMVANWDRMPRLELLDSLGMLDGMTDGQKRLAEKRTGVRITMMMPTLKQFKDVHGQGLVDEIESGEWSCLGGKINRTTWRVDFPGGSVFQPFPAIAGNDKTSRGLRTDVALADECDDIEPAVFDAVAHPWFSEPWSLKIRLLGGTPRRGRHGLLYKSHESGMSKDPLDARYHTFHATYRDAPETVDTEEVEDARRNMSPEVSQREWEANFDSAEGLVYQSFDEQFHVREVPDDFGFHEYFCSGDHGWTDPGVLQLWGVHGHDSDAIVWLLDEIYQSAQIEDWWIEMAKTWRGGSDPDSIWIKRALSRNALPYYLDRSMPARISAFTKHGINAIPAQNAIKPGVDRVANMLAIRETEGAGKYARLYVRPGCKSTIWEFRNYRRKKDPQNPDHYMADIVDKNNHAMDAMRYGLFMRFGPLDGGKHIGSR